MNRTGIFYLAGNKHCVIASRQNYIAQSYYSRQGSGLHDTVSEVGPRSSQFLPPCLGGGLVQNLVRVFEPPPQVAPQSDHFVHSV